MASIKMLCLSDLSVDPVFINEWVYLFAHEVLELKISRLPLPTVVPKGLHHTDTSRSVA